MKNREFLGYLAVMILMLTVDALITILVIAALIKYLGIL